MSGGGDSRDRQGNEGEVRLSWDVSPRNVTGQARDNARVLRRNQTPAECVLWNALRGRKVDGLKFRRQVPVGRFIVDFLCFEAGLVIEADGWQHADINVYDYDEARTRYLNAQGLHILRFTNEDIESHLSEVVEQIARMARSRKHPSMQTSPLPEGRGVGGEAIRQPAAAFDPGTPVPETQ